MDITRRHLLVHDTSAELMPAPASPQTAPVLLLLGSISGLLLHWLVWDRMGGSAGMLLWLGFSCAFAWYLNRHQNYLWQRELFGCISVIMFAASLAVLRDADQVMLLMYLVMLLSLGILFYRSRGASLVGATLPLMFKAALRLPIHVLLAAFPTLDRVIKSNWRSGSQISAVLRGVLIALPLLVIFVSLFASADALFSQQLTRVADLMGELTPSKPLILLLLMTLAIGVLSCSLPHQTEFANQDPQGLWPGLPLHLGRTETAIIMGSLAVLFAGFVALQSAYLFGGRELLETRSGLTVAEYARRGFFELLSVATLTLVLLMALSSARCYPLLLRRLGAVLIGCVMIMLVSALYRLQLYIEQFGLTISRLVALAVMLWTSFGLLWFAATVLRGKARGFLAGLVISSMVCCLLLALINPAARVAEVNLAHARATGTPLDLSYLNSLGADIVPLVLSELQRADSVQASCFAAQRTFSQWHTPNSDWREWNGARAAAHKAVQSALERC